MIAETNPTPKSPAHMKMTMVLIRGEEPIKVAVGTSVGSGVGVVGCGDGVGVGSSVAVGDGVTSSDVAGSVSLGTASVSISVNDSTGDSSVVFVSAMMANARNATSIDADYFQFN